MSNEARVLLDIATLAEVDGEEVCASKLRQGATYIIFLEDRVRSLEEGECRYHCRVRADMWKAGFVEGEGNLDFEENPMRTPDEAYELWRNKYGS